MTTQKTTAITKKITKRTNTKIALKNYAELLTRIKNCIKETSEKIAATSVRQKVVMCWQMGKLINENLSNDNRADYGRRLFSRLESDLSIKKRALYKMQNFYKSYPTLPKDEVNLNWTHYRVLAEIKNTEKRQYLENLTIESNWSTHELEQAVKNLKTNEGLSEQATSGLSKENSKQKKSSKIVRKKLYPVRGKLFSYFITKLDDSTKTYLDLGFGIFREVEENLPKQAAKDAVIVDVTKEKTFVKNKSLATYSLKKSTLHPRKINVYKARLERVVDGDTIRVVVDLGFKTFHKEIIRLKGVNAEEINTKDGKQSYKTLVETLQNVPFLVIKTMGTDIYGRYVADIFLAEKQKKSAAEIDPQKVADEGIYLNQLLLDKGSVEIAS